jgi:hypothetical protein
VSSCSSSFILKHASSSILKIVSSCPFILKSNDLLHLITVMLFVSVSSTCIKLLSSSFFSKI